MHSSVAMFTLITLTVVISEPGNNRQSRWGVATARESSCVKILRANYSRALWLWQHPNNHARGHARPAFEACKSLRALHKALPASRCELSFRPSNRFFQLLAFRSSSLGGPAVQSPKGAQT